MRANPLVMKAGKKGGFLNSKSLKARLRHIASFTHFTPFPAHSLRGVFHSPQRLASRSAPRVRVISVVASGDTTNMNAANQSFARPFPAVGHGGCPAIPCARCSAAHLPIVAAPCSAACNSGSAKRRLAPCRFSAHRPRLSQGSPPGALRRFTRPHVARRKPHPPAPADGCCSRHNRMS